jgi:hypothetical protein
MSSKEIGWYPEQQRQVGTWPLANDIFGGLKTHRMDFGQGIGQVDGVLRRSGSFDDIYLFICIQTGDRRHIDISKVKALYSEKNLGRHAEECRPVVPVD